MATNMELLCDYSDADNAQVLPIQYSDTSANEDN